MKKKKDSEKLRKTYDNKRIRNAQVDRKNQENFVA
jgi:hypothetical protein